MPRWSPKDERQYEHIKESEREQGRPAGKAEEIAARTVNKQRRSEGRTPDMRTQGTGNPGRRLESRTLDELHNRAEQLSIAGAARLPRAELITAIRRRNGNASS